MLRCLLFFLLLFPSMIMASPPKTVKETLTSTFLSLYPSHQEEKIEGVIGATCWANPIYFIEGRDVCFSVAERFYPGVLMLVAKNSMIKLCEEANVFDASGGHCYRLCKTQTYCTYMDNR